MASTRLANDPYDRLSARKRDILRYLGKGMDATAIALKVGLSTETLASVFEDLRRELGLSSLEKLRAYTLRRIVAAGPVVPSNQAVSQLSLPFGSDGSTD